MEDGWVTYVPPLRETMFSDGELEEEIAKMTQLVRDMTTMHLEFGKKYKEFVKKLERFPLYIRVDIVSMWHKKYKENPHYGQRTP